MTDQKTGGTNGANADSQGTDKGLIAGANDAVHDAADRATAAIGGLPGAIEANPLAALLGGLALGAIAGALLPRSEREAELLGPVGDRIAGAAREAFGAAREAGFGAFDEAGFNKDAARAQIDKLVEAATAAAREAGTAAFAAVRDSNRG